MKRNEAHDPKPRIQGVTLVSIAEALVLEVSHLYDLVPWFCVGWLLIFDPMYPQISLSPR